MKRYPTRYPGVMYRLTASGERRYQISYTDSNGTRVFDTVEGNERDAVRQRNQILERMHKGERVVKSNLTLKQLADDYHRTQTGHLRDSTRRAYGYSIDHWIIPALGNRKVAEVGVDDIADFIAEMRQVHAAWTVRGCLTPLSRMFQYAVRRGWAAQNPVTALDRTERPKGSSKKMRILSTEEIAILLSAATPTYKLLIMTAIFTGLRIGELLRMRWENVNLSEGVVNVPESKTEAGVRQVVMPDFLVTELQVASLYQNEGFVFKTKDGTQMKHRRVNRALEETLKRAGVDHCRFHDLRHTFASILISQAADATYLADQMGHSSPNTSYGIYGHLLDPKKRRKEMREKMQENFKEVVT